MLSGPAADRRDSPQYGRSRGFAALLGPLPPWCSTDGRAKPPGFRKRLDDNLRRGAVGCARGDMPRPERQTGRLGKRVRSTRMCAGCTVLACAGANGLTRATLPLGRETRAQRELATLLIMRPGSRDAESADTKFELR